MKKIVLNLFLWILFTLMQCGPVVGTLEYGDAGGPIDTLWLMLPFSLMCLGLVVITTGFAIPRLLMRQKWGVYAALEFFLSYVVALFEQLLVIYIWTQWEIMPSDHNINWGWLAVNTLCNSLMLFYTLLAVGGWRLFDSARRDVAKEKILVSRIESYIASVKQQLQPEDLSRRMGEIADKVELAPQEAEKDITALASEIRENLYNLPIPPTIDNDTEARNREDRKFNRFLTSRSNHAMRIVIFQLSLICICFGAFFAHPDRPEFSSRFGGFIILLAMFEIIAAIDIFVLFRLFRRKRRLGRFILASGLLAVIVIFPIVAERVVIYLNHPYNDALFILTTTLATIASILMIAFYIAGIGAVLLYQDWLRHTHRLISMQATTKRLEYANLKKQINPHFLFNVLNNAGILTMLDTSDARKILIELRRLIDYQFNETESPTVRLTDTISFLRAYLMLESTRRNDFRFNIACEGQTEGIEVPSLLFIPFVENAVKYAASASDIDRVRITFEIKGSRLIFECENPVDDIFQNEHIPEAGGIGITNTLRRLELLYDDNFSYSVRRNKGLYRMVLNIPVDTTMILI